MSRKPRSARETERARTQQLLRDLEHASPAERRAMLDQRKAEESARLLDRIHGRPEPTSGPSVPPGETEEVREWLDRVRGPQPTNLDDL